MRTLRALFICAVVCIATTSFLQARIQDAKPPAAKAGDQAAPAPARDAKAGQEYSGMYTFQKEGEFVQLTVEDDGHVTGFVSRYGDGNSDKGAFLDQFFKSGKLEGNQLSFTTDTVHGVSFDFKGTVERGEGKSPGDEAYYLLRGTLTENSSDASKKITSRVRDVVFKIFPQDAGAEPAARN
jgi:hypothetical protein